MRQKELENYIYAYGKDLYSFCCSLTRNRQKADDLYQDTFVKLYDIGDKTLIHTNPKSFLMSIALNLYRNDRRKISVRERITGVNISLNETADSIPSGDRTAEDEIVAREEGRMVREAVCSLPDKYRIPILLYYMEEFSIAETAELMRIPENTVKTRLRRAKKILKEKLEESL